MADRETVSLRIPTALLTQAQKYADAHGISRNAALTLAIARGLPPAEHPNNQRTERY